MVLSDRTIKAKLATKELTISPFSLEQLQPCSYDVRLGNELLVFDDVKDIVIDPTKDNAKNMRRIKVEDGEYFVLHPRQFALGVTMEEVGVSADYVFILNGKSSLGRLGLLIHATAGFIDPGNSLHVTLELFNVAPMPIILRPGMKIGQVVFESLTETCERPYGSPGLGSKYFHSQTVEASRMHLNYTIDEEVTLPNQPKGKVASTVEEVAPTGSMKDLTEQLTREAVNLNLATQINS